MEQLVHSKMRISQISRNFEISFHTERSRAKKIFDFHGSGSRSVLFAVLTTVVASALSSVSNPFDGDDDDEDIEESRVESGQ